MLRLDSDPANNLGQGEATMTNGGGIQTSASGRWGDYGMTTIDPADNVSFWHTDQYYATTGIIWSTKVGKVQFPAQTPMPRPRPTPPPRP